MPLPEDVDGVHILNDEERRKIRRIEHGAVFRAFMAGVFSATVSAAASLYMYLMHDNTGNGTEAEVFNYWAVVGGATVVATIIELSFLYWDALRSVHKLSHAAGLTLYKTDDDESKAVLNALVRAALELPNPREGLYIDPHRESSKWKILVASIVYKLKITISNFVVKALVRRMLGRVGARAYLEFVAVPVTAAWNGIVCWWIMREARIRAMGPSAVEEMIEIIFSTDDGHITEAERLASLRAVGGAIVRTKDLHPNLHYLLDTLVDKLGIQDGEEIDNSQLLLDSMKNANPDEQKLALKFVTIATVVDGKISRAEKELLYDLQEACGIPKSKTAAHDLLVAFRSGYAIPEEVIVAIGSAIDEKKPQEQVPA